MGKHKLFNLTRARMQIFQTILKKQLAAAAARFAFIEVDA